MKVRTVVLHSWSENDVYLVYSVHVMDTLLVDHLSAMCTVDVHAMYINSE